MTVNSQAKYDGYVILPSGDTVTGSILIPISSGALDFASVSSKIRFVDSSEKVKTYKPNKIKGFGIKADELSGNYLSLAIEGKHLFLKRITNGYWQVYQDIRSLYRASYPIGFNGTSVGPTSKYGEKIDYFIIYKNEPVKLLKKSKGKLDVKQLQLIFKDYPVILSKLKEEIQWYELKEIIDKFEGS